MMDARWFPGAHLNFAENLLRFRNDKTALIFIGEDKTTRRISYAALYDEVARLAKSLRQKGVKANDRVAGFMPNMIETVCAMLATTGIGAVWSSCSPDFGVKGALDRFAQIKPKVLFTTNGYYYNGKTFPTRDKLNGVMKGLPTVEQVVMVPYAKTEEVEIDCVTDVCSYQEFLSHENNVEIDFAQLPSGHPVYIMYSSGTTGLPKCIVQGAAGVLTGHLRDLILHTDLKQSDTIFYATTCGWMMWNWLVSSLAVGATILLYDGSFFYPEPDVLFQVAAEEEITVFGTSAKYLTELEKSGAKPVAKNNLTNLKAILSTGSPLSTGNFQYVYRDIKQDLMLSSISGGTDINGCFLLGNPNLPVYPGELQCKGLGMDVQAFDETGKQVVGEKGELVCLNPYPSMPLYFWNDPDKKKYREAYFSVYPNVWRHGDYIELTETGGAVIYGRSDATLNPSGVRIGTAEIYRVVEAIGEIRDSIVAGQHWHNDVRIILFVKLAEGIVLTEDLIKKIRTAIRTELSPRHVPAKVIAVPEIPYTVNGKKVEIAVNRIINGEIVVNRESLAAPAVLDYYQNIDELKT
jgi:acetoacetyl-CoA synthetase